MTPPPGGRRDPGIDGLRGIAILLVVICHTALYAELSVRSGGWFWQRLSVGVVLFFAISGFLVYRPFVVAHARELPAPRVRDYARRRALRILPAYWVALTVLSLWPGTTGDVLGGGWWRFYGLVQVYSSTSLTQGLGVSWSLCVELSFYLLLPLFAWLVARLAGALTLSWWRAELAAIVAFGGAGVAFCAPLLLLQWPTWWATTLATTSSLFAMGMALAVLSVAAESGGVRARRIQHRIARHGHLLWLAAPFVFLASARLLWLMGRWPAIDPEIHRTAMAIGACGERALVGLVAALVLAPVVAGAGGLVRAVSTWRPLTLLGLVSYGVFLWHNIPSIWLSGHDPDTTAGPALTAFLPLTAATLALSIVLATASYRLIERPAARWKVPGGRPRLVMSARRPTSPSG